MREMLSVEEKLYRLGVRNVRMVRRRQRWQLMKRVGVFLGKTLAMLAIVAAVAMLGGCATAQKPAQIGMPAAVSALIRVGNSGVDCDSQDKFLRDAVVQVFAAARIQPPKTIVVRPLAGSSLCGNIVRTDQQAPDGIAKAELTIYWSSITNTELQRANALIALMRPRPF